ncbi:hypothetical protein Bbelb_282300 [Branchiostoma belcheri]|nr:hypothetical protein Bbelb_282300 [Branchiostoma belcheri]
MTKRRMALQRAVTVYLEEGRILSSDFLLPAGEAGCETAMLAFLQEDNTGVPTWEDMTGGKEFTVVFDMPYDILGILQAQDVLTLNFYRHKWFSTRKGSVPHLYDGYKNGGSNDVQAKKVSVQGLVMTYDEGTGVFTVTDDDFTASATLLTDLPEWVKGRDVARAEYKQLLNHLSQQRKCIHFTAASEGDIFVVFASIPQNHETWIYVQISPEGVALYKALRLQTTQLNDDAGGLGSATLYQSYFVCVTEDVDEMTTERPHVWLSFTFNEVASLRYYSFGSGESPVKVMGLSLLDKPAKDFIICREGTEMINGVCQQKCHPECNGCRISGSNSPTDCIACKHLKVSYPYREGQTGDFECVAQCPQHMKSDTATKPVHVRIKRMEETRPDGVVDCVTECPLTHFGDNNVCKNCDTCKYQHEGRCVEGCRPGQKAVKVHVAFSLRKFPNELRIPIKESTHDLGLVGDKYSRLKPDLQDVTTASKVCSEERKTSFSGSMFWKAVLSAAHATALSVFFSCRCTLPFGAPNTPPPGRALGNDPVGMTKRRASLPETYIFLPDVLRESAGRCAGLPSGECGTSSGRVRYVLRESAVRPAGEYADSNNAFTCLPCHPGHECKLGDEREDICPAGTVSNDNRTMCVPCAAGEFSSAPGAASCQKCPAGQYSSRAGTSDARAPYVPCGRSTGEYGLLAFWDSLSTSSQLIQFSKLPLSVSPPGVSGTDPPSLITSGAPGQRLPGGTAAVFMTDQHRIATGNIRTMYMYQAGRTIEDVRVMRGAEVPSDHYKPNRTTKPRRRFNVGLLRNLGVQASFQLNRFQALQDQLESQGMDIEKQWQHTKKIWLGIRYLGCYEDQEERIFPSDRMDSDQMTSDVCIQHCTSHGHQYAATQFSRECWCGSRDDFLGIGERRPESECNRRCSGRTTADEMCGGTWRMSVYRTGRSEARFCGRTGSPPPRCPSPLACCETRQDPRGGARPACPDCPSTRTSPSTPTGTGWRQIPGKLKQVEAGLSGRQAWGVNSGDSIFLRTQPTDPAWWSVDGLLKFVSVGSRGVWGVNRNDDIFYRSGTYKNLASSGSGWVKIEGKLKQISSGHSVWGVNANDDIFIRQGVTSTNPTGSDWLHVGGKLKQLDVSSTTNQLWGVNSNDNIFRRTGISTEQPAGTGWEQIEGSLKFVSVGPAGVWGVNSNDDIFYRTGTFGNEASSGSGWEHIQGKLKQISSGDNIVWGVNVNDDIFVREAPKPSDQSKKTQKCKPVTNKNKVNITIPYVQGVSEKLRRIFQNFNIATNFKPHSTLRQRLVHPDKDRPHKAIFHYLQHNQGHYFKLESTDILDRETRWWERDVKEAIYERMYNPTLNREGGLRVDLSGT